MWKFSTIMIFVGAVFLLSGCDTFGTHNSERTLTETGVIKRAWFERDQPTNIEPIYCYKTLVELECFDRVREKDERPAVWTYKAVHK